MCLHQQLKIWHGCMRALLSGDFGCVMYAASRCRTPFPCRAQLMQIVCMRACGFELSLGSSCMCNSNKGWR